jgi:MtfA peptidase
MNSNIFKQRPYFAGIMSFFALFGALILSYPLYRQQILNIFLVLPFDLIISYLVFHRLSRRFRKRKMIMQTSFPGNWQNLLMSNVNFYRNLSKEKKQQFEKEIQLFLGEKKITGIDTNVTDQDKILVAASAVIPVFGFPNWEYFNLDEVLLYPNSFNHHFDITGNERNILGMVGDGFLNRKMILSKPDLYSGFQHPENKMNVGIHEFAHLIDKSDGLVDGLPAVFLEHEYALPWIKLVHSEMKRILKNKSDINPYGATNEQEFFAVVSEYFFQRPDLLKIKHPDLYKLLNKVFRQEPDYRFNRLKIGSKMKKKYIDPQK